MKFFIGAKNLTGQVIVAEIVEAKDFSGALLYLESEAQRAVGVDNYRLTAVNEYVELGSQSSFVKSRTAEFLEGARA